MKRLLLVLIITLSLQSWTKADDIRDFEIEGMSIGDLALDFFTKSEIEDRKKIGFVYEKKDFYSATFYNKNFFDVYDNVQLHLKKDDEKFKIYSVGGQKDLNNYQNKCFNEMENVLSSIRTLFSDAKVVDDGVSDWTAPQNISSKVKSYYIQLESKDEISIQCYDHPENSDYKDYLLIAIDSAEFAKWLYN